MNEIETFYGLIESTSDALRVFELSRQGRLGRVRRRLHERERKWIRSGSVFVFDEQESGIKRWTDGRLWSPSRILGNFLIYRELEGKSVSNSSGMLVEDNLADIIPWLDEPVIPDPGLIDPGALLAFASRSIKGTLTDTSVSSPSSVLGPQSLQLLKSKKLINNHKGRYIFKSDGLIKKTISARIDGHMHHLICYYNRMDFCKGHLGGVFDPRLMVELRKVKIPPDLVLQQNFRKPAAVECGIGSLVTNHTNRSVKAQTIPIQRQPRPTGSKRRSSCPPFPIQPQNRMMPNFSIVPFVDGMTTAVLDSPWATSADQLSYADISSMSEDMSSSGDAELQAMQEASYLQNYSQFAMQEALKMDATTSSSTCCPSGPFQACSLCPASTFQSSHSSSYSMSSINDIEQWPSSSSVPSFLNTSQLNLSAVPEFDGQSSDPVLPCVRPASNPSFAWG